MLKYKQSCVVLCDFQAAFPSVSQEFMWQVLKGIGLGDKWIGRNKCFYLENRQFVGRAAEQDFVAEVGIRQGCPPLATHLCGCR